LGGARFEISVKSLNTSKRRRKTFAEHENQAKPCCLLLHNTMQCKTTMKENNLKNALDKAH
jgi:hypothetical protein